jgi:DNA helicase-2/ATP-dependent DNA helicase PcrA
VYKRQAEVAHEFLEVTKQKLTALGWNISEESTKVLMLTNNVLASEQGYQNVAGAFSDNDDFLKLNDPYIEFMVNIVEVGAEAFNKKKYGEMLQAFGIRTARIRCHADKEIWQKSMAQLENIRNQGTVGDLIDLLKTTRKPRLSSKIEEREERREEIIRLPEEDRKEDDVRFLERMTRIRTIPYPEIPNVAKYIDNKTLYSTKHGVKGAEFENVIVVLGRGWNQYNWNQFLEQVNAGNVSESNKDFYERNRNLFYVACSRPRKRLCLLFTQELSSSALFGLQKWFGDAITEA